MSEPLTKKRAAIRFANESDLAEASELCIRSKAHWGYDANFIEACRDELTLRPLHLRKDAVAIAELGGVMVGAAHVEVRGNTAHLAKLFIDPPMIGHGIGKDMFEWAREQTARAGAKTMRLIADPQAAGFYERLGFERDGEEASGSIPGRVLPTYRLKL